MTSSLIYFERCYGKMDFKMMQNHFILDMSAQFKSCPRVFSSHDKELLKMTAFVTLAGMVNSTFPLQWMTLEIDTKPLDVNIGGVRFCFIHK